MDLTVDLLMGSEVSWINMVTINQIRKRYKKREVLGEITFQIEKGTCVGILGDNGSGKSTLLSILAGTQKSDQGSFFYQEIDLLKNPAVRNQVVGYVPQETPFFEELSAKDNLLLWYDKSQLKSELESGVLKRLQIDEFVKLPVAKLSGGMRKRLAIACAVANHPKILLLDEPTAALDVSCKEMIYQYLKEFLSGGGYVVLTTHEAAEFTLCDVSYYLKEGVLLKKD